MTRLANIRSSIAIAIVVLAAPLATYAEDPPVPAQIVDLARKINGVHPGFRPFHAKGIVVEGSFKPAPQARMLSRAAQFNARTTPVTVRFSDGNGIPNVADGSPAANPHGMAIKFHLPGGVDTDMVTNSLKFFPVGTGEDFRDLLLAIMASPPGTAEPTPLQQFFAKHPDAPKALGSAVTPDSYAHEVYHGINAFIFVNQNGQRQAVRYVLVPEKLVHLTPQESVKRSPDFLVNDLTQRLAHGQVVFRLKAQLAEPGDQTKDASQPWPDDRKVVELGVLTLNKVVPDSLEAERKLLFLPTRLTDGIELSDDPLPLVRGSAYAVSFARRSEAASASSSERTK